MCLFDPKQIKLNEDITVYKVLIQDSEKLTSPYYPYDWELNKEYKINDKPVIRDYALYKTISGNTFHTFKNFDDARNERIEILPAFEVYPPNLKIVIAECIIPKSSEYVYEGTFGNAQAYASSSLIIKKIID